MRKRLKDNDHKAEDDESSNGLDNTEGRTAETWLFSYVRFNTSRNAQRVINLIIIARALDTNLDCGCFEWYAESSCRDGDGLRLRSLSLPSTDGSSLATKRCRQFGEHTYALRAVPRGVLGAHSVSGNVWALPCTAWQVVRDFGAPRSAVRERARCELDFGSAQCIAAEGSAKRWLSIRYRRCARCGCRQ